VATAQQEADLAALRTVATMLLDAATTDLERKHAEEGNKAASLLQSAIIAGRVSPTTASRITEMAEAIKVYNFAHALSVQASLVTSDWATMRDFLKAAKHFLNGAKRKMDQAR
jgi:hypothetical protein